MKVAIIDDGVCVNDDIDILYPKTLKHFKIENGQICEDSWEPGITATSHGTICFWIFSHYLNRNDYELYSLKALDLKNSKGRLEDLETALRWCDGQGFDMICMSIGSDSFDSFRLEPLIENLSEQGSIIIAACNNRNTYTFPASSKYVIGVRRDLGDVLADREYIYSDKDISNIELTVELDLRELARKVSYPLDEYREANSFMVPYAAAMIYSMKGDERFILSDVRKRLRQSSKEEDGILSVEYAKKLYQDWHDEVEVPVVAVYQNGLEENLNQFDSYIIELCEKFHQGGYKAIALLDGGNRTNFYIYEMKKVHSLAPCFQDALLLLDHSSMCDIIMMPVSKELLYKYKECFDIVISDDDEISDDFELIPMNKNVEIQYRDMIERME